MIEKIKGIKIRGGRFDRGTTFELFNDEKVRATIVYGKNGSGKTTIARGFRKLMNGKETKEIEASLYDYDNKKILDDMKDNIVVFDEKYVNDNVVFVDDGLRTITLIGTQNTTQKNIEDEEEKKKDKEKEITNNNNKLKTLKDSHKLFWENAKNVLCKADGYRDKKRKINEDSSFTKVDNDLNKILESKVVDKKTDVEV